MADWVPLSTACPGWGSGYNGDLQCLAGADTTTVGGPGALTRSGDWFNGTVAGVFAVLDFQPSISDHRVGFRCAR